MSCICYWIVEKRDRTKTYCYTYFNPGDALAHHRRCKGKIKYVIEAL